MKVDFKITFPITAMVKGKPTFLGTGFFIDQLGGFVTAKHVLDYRDTDKGRPFVILQILDEKTFIPRKVKHIYKHPSADICIGKPNRMVYEEKDFVNPIWDLEFNRPIVGEKINTLAYPNSIRIDDKEHIWEFQPEAFFGLVKEVYDRCPTCRITTECFQTNMEILSGSSGGPVFNSEGKVIGVNSMSHNLAVGETPLGFITPLHYLNEIIISSEGVELTFGELIGKTGQSEHPSPD